LALAVLLAGFGAGPAVAAPTASATRGYVFDGADLVVFDPATNTVTNRIVLDFHASAYAVRPDEREIYVADFSNERIAVIPTASDTIVARIPVGDAPDDVEFSPDSHRAYVLHRSALTVIDTAARRVVATIPLGADSFAFDAAVSPDGSHVYVALDPGNDERSVGVVSTGTNRLTKIIPLPAPVVRLDQVGFSPDGRLALVTSGHVIDTATETVSHRIPPLGVVTHFEFAPDSRRVYVASACGQNGVGTFQLVDIASGQVVRTIITGGNPVWSDLTPDRSQIYVVAFGRGSVMVLDATTERVLDEFGTAGGPGRVLLRQIALVGTVPAQGPGQRFAPQPLGTDACSV
jgi:YVTN family beta-propeller protein